MFLSKRAQRSLIIGFILVSAVITAVLIYLNRPGKVVISAEANASILVATTKGGEFKKIGVGTATYSARNVPADIYIEVAADGKKTISGIKLERGKTKNLKLTLAPQVTATQITTGSVSNVFLDGINGQGVVPDDYTLINFKTDKTSVDPRPEFIGLPYMKKVVWFDANNFIYNSFDEGVGRFIDGQAIYNQDLAANVSGKDFDNRNSNAVIGDLVNLVDIAKASNKPLVLLSENNIFLSSDKGTSIKSVASFESDDAIASNFLFATDDYIYRFAGDDSTAFRERKIQTEEYGSSLYQYNYNGEKLATIPVNDNTLRAVTSKGTKTYILTNEDLVQFDNKNIQNLGLYFNYARDIINYNNKIVMLGDDGLWQIADDGVSLQLLYEFKDSGVGLAQSLSISGNTLIFGTQPKPDDLKSSAKTFATTF